MAIGFFRKLSEYSVIWATMGDRLFDPIMQGVFPLWDDGPRKYDMIVAFYNVIYWIYVSPSQGY